MGIALALLALEVVAYEGVFVAVGVYAESLDELEAVTGHASGLFEGVEFEEGLLSATRQGVVGHGSNKYLEIIFPNTCFVKYK